MKWKFQNVLQFLVTLPYKVRYLTLLPTQDSTLDGRYELHTSISMMASGHGGAVMRNLCYTPPRHPGTVKPATINERARSSLETEPLEGLGLNTLSEDKPPSSRRHKRHHQGHKPKLSVRDSLSQSLRELDDVDEEHFYDHLLALKNEHKKTLKAVEKLYYSEKDRQDSGFQLDPRTRITVSDYDESSIPKNFPLRDYDPILEMTEDEEKDDTNVPVRPEDHVRDLSVRDERTTEDKENEGRENFSSNFLFMSSM